MPKPEEIHLKGDQDSGDFVLTYTGNARSDHGLLRLILTLARSFGFEVPVSRFDREEFGPTASGLELPPGP
jgi:hypothetical protein